MGELTKERFEMAGAFVSDHGRPVEQARWRHEFESGDAADIWDALAEYQNEDDGFGHALEPDMRTPESSALATQTAIQALRDSGASKQHPLVVSAVNFLITTFDFNTRVWQFVPESSDDHPHAPWWDFGQLAETFEGFRINPRANLLGHLCWAEHPDTKPIIDALESDVLEEFYSTTGPVGNNDFLCYLNMVSSLGNQAQPRAVEHLLDLAGQSVERDPSMWNTYCLKPLDVVKHPAGPLYAEFRESVEAQLDFEIESQSDNGSWLPAWSWFGRFPEDWPTAEREWSGHMTVETVASLKRFDRLTK